MFHFSYFIVSALHICMNFCKRWNEVNLSLQFFKVIQNVVLASSFLFRSRAITNGTARTDMNDAQSWECLLSCVYVERLAFHCFFYRAFQLAIILHFITAHWKLMLTAKYHTHKGGVSVKISLAYFSFPEVCSHLNIIIWKNNCSANWNEFTLISCMTFFQNYENVL